MHRISSRSRKYDFLGAQSAYSTYLPPAKQRATRRDKQIVTEIIANVNFEINNFLSSIIFPLVLLSFFSSSFDHSSKQIENRFPLIHFQMILERKFRNKDYNYFLSSIIFPFALFSFFLLVSIIHGNRADFHSDRVERVQSSAIEANSVYRGKWFCERWPEQQFNFPDPRPCTGLVTPRIQSDPDLMHADTRSQLLSIANLSTLRAKF